MIGLEGMKTLERERGREKERKKRKKGSKIERMQMLMDLRFKHDDGFEEKERREEERKGERKKKEIEKNVLHFAGRKKVPSFPFPSPVLEHRKGKKSSIRMKVEHSHYFFSFVFSCLPFR